MATCNLLSGKWLDNKVHRNTHVTQVICISALRNYKKENNFARDLFPVESLNNEIFKQNT